MVIGRPLSLSRQLFAALIAVLVAGGCGAPASPPASAPPNRLPGDVPLPTFAPTVNGYTQACAGVGYPMEVRIHGSASDPALAWVVFPDGHRENLLWPPGYHAQFSPGITVLNRQDHVVAREGELVTGACPMEPHGLMIDIPTVAATPSVAAAPS